MKLVSSPKSTAQPLDSAVALPDACTSQHRVSDVFYSKKGRRYAA